MERETGPEAVRAERQAAEVVATGSMVEVAAGIGAIVLGILGLAGVAAQTLAAIGVIAVGVALLFEGAAIISRYNDLSRDVDGSWTTASELGGGVTLEFLGGLAVAVLGVLALLSLAPIKLMAIGVIAYGATLLLSAGTMSRLNHIKAEAHPGPTVHETLARDAVFGTTTIQMMVGAGGVVLGILSVVGTRPETLILVALLAFGSAILLSGSALTGRMLSLIHG